MRNMNIINLRLFPLRIFISSDYFDVDINLFWFCLFNEIKKRNVCLLSGNLSPSRLWHLKPMRQELFVSNHGPKEPPPQRHSFYHNPSFFSELSHPSTSLSSLLSYSGALSLMTSPSFCDTTFFSWLENAAFCPLSLPLQSLCPCSIYV